MLPDAPKNGKVIGPRGPFAAKLPRFDLDHYAIVTKR
jgi:hypothetical protein